MLCFYLHCVCIMHVFIFELCLYLYLYCVCIVFVIALGLCLYCICAFINGGWFSPQIVGETTDSYQSGWAAVLYDVIVWGSGVIYIHL